MKKFISVVIFSAIALPFITKNFNARLEAKQTTNQVEKVAYKFRCIDGELFRSAINEEVYSRMKEVDKIVDREHFVFKVAKCKEDIIDGKIIITRVK